MEMCERSSMASSGYLCLKNTCLETYKSVPAPDVCCILRFFLSHSWRTHPPVVLDEALLFFKQENFTVLPHQWSYLNVNKWTCACEWFRRKRNRQWESFSNWECLWSSSPLNAAPSRETTCLTAWRTQAEQYNRFLTRPEEGWVYCWCWWMLPKYHSCQWCRAGDDEGQREEQMNEKEGRGDRKEVWSGTKCVIIGIRTGALIWNGEKMMLMRRWTYRRQKEEDSCQTL